MNSLEELIGALQKDDKTLLGFALKGKMWMMYAHDKMLAGMIPTLEESRDSLDFHFKMKSWEKAGRFIFSMGKSFDEMIQAAIEQLNK